MNTAEMLVLDVVGLGGGVVVPPIATMWSASDITPGIALSNGNLTATYASSATASVARAVKGNVGIAAGEKKYFEVVINNIAGGAESYAVGLSSVASPPQMAYPGGAAFSIGYFNNGKVYRNALVATLAAFTTAGNVGVAVDRSNNKVWLRVNGGNWNNDVIGNQNPATNTGGIAISTLVALATEILYPQTYFETVNDAMSAAFLATVWTYAAPSGFTALAGYNGVGTVVSGSGYYNWPACAQLPNGHHICVYAWTAAFETQPSTFSSKISTNNGATWGVATDFYSPAATFAAPTGLKLLANGTLLLSFFETVGGTSVAYVKIGTISGDTVTWGNKIVVTNSFTSYSRSAGPPIQLGDGTLRLPIYGKNLLDLQEHCAIITGNAAGTSWTTQVDIASNPATQEASEAWGILWSDTTITWIIRRDVDVSGYAEVHSSDSGATYSALATVITTGAQPGMPTLMLLPSDKLFLISRPAGGRNTGWWTSLDKGLTWTAAPSPTAGRQYGLTTWNNAYCGVCPISASLFGAAIAMYNSGGGISKVDFQTFTLD